MKPYAPAVLLVHSLYMRYNSASRGAVQAIVQDGFRRPEVLHRVWCAACTRVDKAHKRNMNKRKLIHRRRHAFREIIKQH